MTLPPLNGSKTHPLTGAALAVLARLAGSPIPRPEVNPGVVNRLLREELAAWVSLPSPYPTRPGQYPHLQITDQGRAVLSLNPPKGHPVTLVCWSCGKEKHGTVNRLPQFAFEVAGMAKDLGWVGAMDTYHGRSLVFCSTACRDAQVTKRGTFRLRPRPCKPQGV